MYFYFALMGIFGIMVMLGYKYRAQHVLLCAHVDLRVSVMQKTSYNNHYYLMMLLCWLMILLPANRWLSLDAKINPALKSPSAPRWTYLIVIVQVWIVYTFASLAKFYPAWTDGTVAALFMKSKSNYWLIGNFLQLEWVHYCMAYVGIVFDLLIVPLLLWRCPF